MLEENEKQINKFIGSNCVIRDDNHDWGGPAEPEPEIKPKEKIKEKNKNDEPMNWPFHR